LKKPSIVERIESHPLTQTGVALLSTFHPAGAVLPTLLSCAANERMQNRIDEVLKELEESLSVMGDRVTAMSDAQYKVVCESLSHLQRTSDSKKIEYLKRAVINGVLDSDISSEKAYVASRVLRDVSALEVDFLISAMPHDQIYIVTANPDGSIPVTDPQAFMVANSLENQMIVSGLISLGLIAENGAWKTGYVFTPVAFTLLALLK
jgi:hypothetical protein